MKNKHILTGIFVFLFSAMALYLVLDTGKETYATDLVEDLCTANGHGSMVGNKCVCDQGYSITTSENATCQPYTLDFEENEGYDYNTDPVYGYVIIFWDSSIDQERACNSVNGLLTPAADTFYWNDDDNRCVVNVYEESEGGSFIGASHDYSYIAADGGYCYDGYEYDTERRKCSTGLATNTGGTIDNPLITYVENTDPNSDYDGWAIVDWGLSIDSTQDRCNQIDSSVSDFEWEGTNDDGNCVAYVYRATPYYKAPSDVYCVPNVFTYSFDNGIGFCLKNSSSNNEPSDPSDPDDPVEPPTLVERQVYYKCSEDENIECNMFTPNFDAQLDTLEFPITEEKPSRDKYTFLYWQTSSGKYHYYSSCDSNPGKSDSKCRDVVKLKTSTTQVTMYAQWEEKTSSGGSTNTNPRLKYVCGSYNGKDIECEDLPDIQYAKNASGGTLKISTKIPTDNSGKYEFAYWSHNPAKTYIYHPTCNGLSSCKTEIPITKNNTLYAHWEPKTSSSEPTNSVYIKYRCGSYQEGDIEYDVDCKNLPTDTQAVNGTGYVSSTIPTDKNGELEFLYWKSKYFGDDVSFCSSGCDRDRINKMSKNNFLYAVWQLKDTSSTGNYTIEYYCSDEKCSGISNTTGNKSPLTITDKIPEKDGYIFLYWEPFSEYNDAKLYCNPSNRLDFDCYKTMKFGTNGTVKVKAVWMEEDEELPGTSVSDKTSNGSNNGTNPGTGSSALYVAIILCLAMLGYSYYYFRKAKNN